MTGSDRPADPAGASATLPGLSSLLEELLLGEVTGPRDQSRVLVTGWFSFLDGEVTAGDALAQRTVSAALERLKVPHDTAWSPVFAPGALTLDDARPGDYSHVLFVCGPLHGEQIAALHHRYASCRRVAVGVSVVARDSAAAGGFHRILERDGPDGGTLPDLSAAAPAMVPTPVVGVALTHGQGEYGERRLHDGAAGTVLPWLAGKDCARIEADTRLAHDDWRHCRTPDQYLSLLGRLDLLVTDRLHGLVLALRAGVPVLAVDPVRGGAKVTAQAHLLRWPAVLSGESVSPELLDHWWDWCRSPASASAARRRRAWMAAARRSTHVPASGVGAAGPFQGAQSCLDRE